MKLSDVVCGDQHGITESFGRNSFTVQELHCVFSAQKSHLVKILVHYAVYLMVFYCLYVGIYGVHSNKRDFVLEAFFRQNFPIITDSIAGSDEDCVNLRM